MTARSARLDGEEQQDGQGGTLVPFDFFVWWGDVLNFSLLWGC